MWKRCWARSLSSFVLANRLVLLLTDLCFQHIDPQHEHANTKDDRRLWRRQRESTTNHGTYKKRAYCRHPPTVLDQLCAGREGIRGAKDAVQIAILLVSTCVNSP